MYNVTVETDAAKQARHKLEGRFIKGEEDRNELVARVSNLVIRDRLVPPLQMAFSALRFDEASKTEISIDADEGLFLEYLGKNETLYTIHPHALSQLASVAGIPKLYVNRLRDGKLWEKQLLVTNLRELFHKSEFKERKGQSAMFLHRLVGTELRGFLSRSYNRHLASAPLLRAFVEACEQVGAKPIEATASDVKLSLKCYLPYVFEPVDGEFVGIGTNWTNSDFGCGKLKVSLSVMRISSGTASVLEDKVSRVHLGSIIQESDIEMSDETAAKEVEAIASAIRDAVNTQLEPGPVHKLLEVIRLAHEQEVPWHKLKLELSRLLQKKELEMIEQMLKTGGDAIMDLPPPGKTASGDPIATRWWASNVVGWVAATEKSEERKQDLQALAGEVLVAA